MTTVGVFAHVADEHGWVLCVRHNYGDLYWSMSGGRVEPGEDPGLALVREVFEEAACVVEVGSLLGVYAAPYKDDLVLLFEARLLHRRDWQPNDEIAEIGFYPLDGLPRPMAANARLRFSDVTAGVRGVFRSLSEPGVIAVR